MNTTHTNAATGTPAPSFWDRIAERYSRKPIADAAAYERKLAMTREILDPSMDVLEIGCGTGGTALLHAGHARHILATDSSAAMIAIARRNLDESDVKNVEFAVAAAADIDPSDRPFDMVLALSVLHLLDDRKAALRKFAKVLAPGGYLVASTPCLEGTIGVMRFILPLGASLGLMPRVASFSKDDLAGDVADAGFEIVSEFHPIDRRTLFFVARLPGARQTVGRSPARTHGSRL